MAWANVERAPLRGWAASATATMWPICYAWNITCFCALVWRNYLLRKSTNRNTSSQVPYLGATFKLLSEPRSQTRTPTTLIEHVPSWLKIKISHPILNRGLPNKKTTMNIRWSLGPICARPNWLSDSASTLKNRTPSQTNNIPELLI
jgi:hypothetical protein